MSADFYWYAWTITIIVFFFVNKKTMRNDVLLLTGFTMCTYAFSSWSPPLHLYIHVFFLLVLGTHIWLRRTRGFFDHFWPFILSMGYASTFMFYVIHPVWANFPAMSSGIVLVIILIRMIIGDVEGQIGIWLLMNAGGTLFSYGIFSLYSNEGLIESQSMMIFAFKGLLIIFLINSIENLKRHIQRKKKSTPKGAAFV